MQEYKEYFKKLPARFSLISFICQLAMFFVFITTVNSHARSFKIGADAPDFTGTNFFSGEEITYSKDLKGKKVVLLDFWSAYCVSCEKEFPKLVEIYEKYKDKDIYFIGVNLDTSSIRLKYYFKDTTKILPYVTIHDKTRSISKAFSTSILPTTVIIDKEGKIALYHVGYKAGDEAHIKAIIDNLTK